MRYNFNGHRFSFLHPANTNKLEELLSYLMLEYDYRQDHWNIKQDDLVIDIGVDAGSYTLTALAMGAEVIAIEPRTESIRNLRRNVSMNPGFAQHLQVIPTALDDKAGTTCFNQSGFKSSANTTGCDERVRTMRLDDLHLDPDWIKIDTEGSELRILKGGAYTIRHSRPNILVEAHMTFDRQMDRKVMGLLRHLNPNYRFIITTDLWGMISGEVKRVRAIP